MWTKHWQQRVQNEQRHLFSSCGQNTSIISCGRHERKYTFQQKDRRNAFRVAGVGRNRHKLGSPWCSMCVHARLFIALEPRTNRLRWNKVDHQWNMVKKQVKHCEQQVKHCEAKGKTESSYSNPSFRNAQSLSRKPPVTPTRHPPSSSKKSRALPVPRSPSSSKTSRSPPVPRSSSSSKTSRALPVQRPPSSSKATRAPPVQIRQSKNGHRKACRLGPSSKVDHHES